MLCCCHRAFHLDLSTLARPRGDHGRGVAVKRGIFGRANGSSAYAACHIQHTARDGMVGGILLHWAFWSVRFDWFQNLIIAVASFIDVGGIIGSLWVSTGLKFWRM